MLRFWTQKFFGASGFDSSGRPETPEKAWGFQPGVTVGRLGTTLARMGGMRSIADNGGKGGRREFLAGGGAESRELLPAERPVGVDSAKLRLAFRASDVFPHLPFAPVRALFFAFSLVLLIASPVQVLAEDAVRRIEFPVASFTGVKEALIESIEGSGLVVTAVIPFNLMLERTAGDLGRRESPFSDALVVQFCSARLAWQLVEEDAAQIALCPMSMVVYRRTAAPESVFLAYRSPGAESPGRRAGEALLAGLAAKAAELVRLGW